MRADRTVGAIGGNARVCESADLFVVAGRSNRDLSVWRQVYYRNFPGDIASRNRDNVQTRFPLMSPWRPKFPGLQSIKSHLPQVYSILARELEGVAKQNGK